MVATLRRQQAHHLPFDPDGIGWCSPTFPVEKRIPE